MATQSFQLEQAPPEASKELPAGRYLFGPLVDFLCLGGSSLIILPLLLLVPVADYEAPIAVTMLLAAHVLNHPHFAHSYQIFYRRFRTKAFTPALGRAMQVRYLLSGLVVPILLFAFFAVSLARGDVRLLGQAGNIMALAVGWHYAKQGYGMLMVDAALKRQFFSASEKKILLVNCYAVWIAAWTAFNDRVSEKALWGIHYYTFGLPDVLVAAAAAAAIVTSGLSAWALFVRRRATGALPVNGVVAYGVSLYVWLLFIEINPLWVLVVPPLHSLQYLVVVWRFQASYEKEQLASAEYKAGSLARRIFGGHVAGHMLVFAVGGIVAGMLGFWGLPILLSSWIPYERAIFGGTLFLFVAWIFINVHHYFLDTVMWRRENPDTRRYLFG